jgi:hypothetical protein
LAAIEVVVDWLRVAVIGEGVDKELRSLEFSQGKEFGQKL